MGEDRFPRLSRISLVLRWLLIVLESGSKTRWWPGSLESSTPGGEDIRAGRASCSPLVLAFSGRTCQTRPWANSQGQWQGPEPSTTAQYGRKVRGQRRSRVRELSAAITI